MKDDTERIENDDLLHIRAIDSLNQLNNDVEDFNIEVANLKLAQKFFPEAVIEKIEISFDDKTIESEKLLLKQLELLQKAVIEHVHSDKTINQSLIVAKYFEFAKSENIFNKGKINTNNILQYNQETDSYTLRAFIDGQVSMELELEIIQDNKYTSSPTTKTKSRTRFLYNDKYRCSVRKVSDALSLNFYNPSATSQNPLEQNVTIQYRTSINLHDGIVVGTSLQAYGDIFINGIKYGFSDTQFPIARTNSVSEISRTIHLLLLNSNTEDRYVIRSYSDQKKFIIDNFGTKMQDNQIIQTIQSSYLTAVNFQESPLTLIPRILRSSVNVRETGRRIKFPEFELEQLYFSSKDLGGRRIIIDFNHTNFNFEDPGTMLSQPNFTNLFSELYKKIISKISIESASGEMIYSEDSENLLTVISRVLDQDDNVIDNSYILDIRLSGYAESVLLTLGQDRSSFQFGISGKSSNFFINEAGLTTKE